MNKKRRKYKIKKKFKNIKFKLSIRQSKNLETYCKVHNTTTNKIIKNAIKEFLSKYHKLPQEENFVTENQLQLFSESGHSKSKELDFID
jgi:hypothetical protein